MLNIIASVGSHYYNVNAMNMNKIQSGIYGFVPTEIEGAELLAELALDMRWSWNHEADKLWQQLDDSLWEQTHNPWVILQTVAYDKLQKAMADADFRKLLSELLNAKEGQRTSPAWFQQTHSDAQLSHIAYFSMEFMLSEALPVYVGGLGNVAGDQLKAASDLGVPVAAVGLLYQQGYFRQQIDKDGNQQAYFPFNDPGQLPVTPLRLPNGEWLRIKVVLAGCPVWLRTWQVLAGRVSLYLLDSNDPVNLPMHRTITSEIYGGDSELRIQQEMLLGIGGWKLLTAIGIKPAVCHLNEEHCAFLILERAHDFMIQTGTSFQEALIATRPGNVFTTHTAVAAGFDHFSTGLMEKFFSNYAVEELGISFNSLMALGRQDAGNKWENFNMVYLAMRGSGTVNAVSELHGQVSRKLFAQLFPRWPLGEVPVSSVTNGVHTPSWDSEFADELWTRASGKGRWRGAQEHLEEIISDIPLHEIWAMRNASRQGLVQYVRAKLEQPLSILRQQQEACTSVFDPHALTLGFARRFVPYKRPTLLLHNPERFSRILTSQEHPVQLVIAGKASPFDEQAKAYIAQWIQFIQQHNLHKHVVFLNDYDMLLTEKLVQGVDVWINTPRRPWEACGTSGMKVLVNGGINLSELDGWWAEGYTPDVGWALGDAQEHGDDPRSDAAEAEQLYDLLEQQVITDFYSRNEDGMPVKWVEKIRNSMSALTPRFSANRVVREYTENYYLPAANNYLQRARNNSAVAKEILQAMQLIENRWEQTRIGESIVENVEEGYDFKVPVWLNGIQPERVFVELYAEGHNDFAEMIIMETDGLQHQGAHWFHAIVSTKRKASDYTARIRPRYQGVSTPLEDNRIKWQR